MNERCKSIYRYVDYVKYYQLVAFLYESAHAGGMIAEDDYFCPLLRDFERYDELLHGKHKRKDRLREIENVISENGLNVDFCDKLRDSPSLRYLVAVGFHDVPIVKIEASKREYKLFIDCGDAPHKPKVGRDIVELCFEDHAVNPSDLTFEPYELYYDRQEIYYDGGLTVFLCLNDRTEKLRTVELQITARDVNIR